MFDIIKFYSPKGPHGYLSNFYKRPIMIRGKNWPTSEHYFQAQKFADTIREEEIRNAKSAMQAAVMGRSRAYPIVEGWDLKRLEVMMDAVWAKFIQHQDLRDLLIGTGDALIVEHTVNDAFWGDGGDGSGKNQLGICLMTVRSIVNGRPISLACEEAEAFWKENQF